MKAGVAGQRRDVFAVDQDAALAALKDAWTEGGYHAFSVDDENLVGDRQRRRGTDRCHPDELDRKIRAHWQEMQ